MIVGIWKCNDDRITHRGRQSRLDRILYRLGGKFVDSLQTDWTFTTSDHCLLILTLRRENCQNKIFNRRIISLPTYILNCKDDLEAIKKGMEEFHSMMNENWDASTKLEFLKTGLRTVVGECVKTRNRREKEELENIQKELKRHVKLVEEGELYSVQNLGF